MRAPACCGLWCTRALFLSAQPSTTPALTSTDSAFYTSLQHAAGRAAWENPALAGAVSLSASRWRTGLHYLLDLHPRLSSSASERGSWFCVALPPFVWLLPTRYSLRHGHTSAGNSLRSWRLLGSADGEEWVTLRHHDNDKALDGRFATQTFAVRRSSALRHFRLEMLDVNSSHNHELRVSGFELYGEASLRASTQMLIVGIVIARAVGYFLSCGWGWALALQVFLDNPVRAMVESEHHFVKRWGLEAMTAAIAWHQVTCTQGLLSSAWCQTPLQCRLVAASIF